MEGYKDYWGPGLSPLCEKAERSGTVQSGEKTTEEKILSTFIFI